MADESQWFYAAEGQRVGPVGEDALRDLLRQGQVTADTLVWCDGMLDWKPLRLSPLAAMGATVVATTPPIPAGEGGPGAPMGPAEAVISCLNKYFQFSGRASRSEYWYFHLSFLLWCILAVALNELRHPLVSLAVVLAILAPVIPAWAVSVRRLHDTGRSGWWLLVQIVPTIRPIVLLVFFCLRPTPGPNRFG